MLSTTSSLGVIQPTIFNIPLSKTLHHHKHHLHQHAQFRTMTSLVLLSHIFSSSSSSSSMANTKNKGQLPKPKASSFLCCFGSLPNKTASIPKQRRAKWFSWPRIRIGINEKNSATKTVPFLEASVLVEKQKLQSNSKRKANKGTHDHDSKPRSKSTIHKSRAPVTNPPPPRQMPTVVTVTANHTPSQTTHGANNVEDTRQQSRTFPTHPKRQVRRLSSSSMQTQTTWKKGKNAYDPVVGMSVVMVTLVIMIFWGRLCAILCTSAWLYFIPRFRKTVENDENDSIKDSNDMVDLDSEAYKKKVIMKGLLERNHRVVL